MEALSVSPSTLYSDISDSQTMTMKLGLSFTFKMRVAKVIWLINRLRL
jgi:hypothetical protein